LTLEPVILSSFAVACNMGRPQSKILG